MGRVGLALATTVLLVAAFPAPDRGELAWIALAPPALACRDLPPVPAAALGLWVALDYARAHAGFLAVAWTALAHSHHRNVPILRVASVTASMGSRSSSQPS